MTAAVVLPPNPVLSAGPGLLLRRHRLEDADAIVEMCRDEAMQRFTTVPVPVPYGRDEAEAFLAAAKAGWEAGTGVALAVEAGGRFAGTVDLRIEDGGWAEVGYGLASWARGRQVATRAVSVVLAWGFGELGLEGVVWRAQVDNEPSWRVAEKCGFRMEGRVRGLLLQRGRRLDGRIATLLPSELVRIAGAQDR